MLAMGAHESGDKGAIDFLTRPQRRYSSVVFPQCGVASGPTQTALVTES